MERSLPKSYGSTAKPSRPRFLVLPLAYCIFVPWAIFCTLLWVRSFQVRYLHPGIATVLEIGIWVLVVLLQFFALGRQARRLQGETAEPSWLSFLAVSVLLAVTCGTLLGEYNFKVNMEPYYDVAMLQTYRNVDPVNARGENLMDAGRIEFTEASRLDLKRSMGFMDTETWCVAPVTTKSLDNNSSQPAVLDFWAIGKNCCAGSKGGDFKCGAWSKRMAHGGLRLLNNQEISYYRLAVQQATAAFQIQVQHPIFLYWMMDPIEEVDAYSRSGHRLFHRSMYIAFWVQLGLVFLAIFFISQLIRS